VAPDHVGLYIVPIQRSATVLGPLVLGPSFDRWGRRVMIPLTYALSGALLLATGGLFVAGALNALTQTLAWMLVFLRRLGRSQLCVSDGERAVPRRAARDGDRRVLRLWHAGRPPERRCWFGAIVDTGDPRGCSPATPWPLP